MQTASNNESPSVKLKLLILLLMVAVVLIEAVVPFANVKVVAATPGQLP